MVDKKVKKEHAKKGAARKRHKVYSKQAKPSLPKDKTLFFVAVLALMAASLFLLESNEIVLVEEPSVSGLAVADIECRCDGSGCVGVSTVQAGEFTIAETITNENAKRNSCSTGSQPGGAPPKLNMLLVGERCVFDENNPGNIIFTHNGGKRENFRSYCIDDNYVIAAESGKRGYVSCDDRDLRIGEEDCNCVNGECQDAPLVGLAAEVPEPQPEPAPRHAPQQPEVQAPPPQPPPAEEVPEVQAAAVNIDSIDKCYEESDCTGNQICRWPLYSGGAKRNQFKLDKAQVCASKIGNGKSCVRNTQCSSGFCYLGQCKQKANCRDEDAGRGNTNKQAEVRSYVFADTRAISDSCTPTKNEPEGLAEGVCKNGKRESKRIDCASLGKVCVDGACVTRGQPARRNGVAREQRQGRQVSYHCDEGFSKGSGRGKIDCIVSRGQLGDSCSENSQCSSNHCAEINMYGVGTCWPKGSFKLIKNNKPCELDAQCEHSLYCKETNRGKKCQRRERPGKPCVTHRQCNSNLCTDGACAPQAEEGQSCYSTKQCKSRMHVCKDGTCQQRQQAEPQPAPQQQQQQGTPPPAPAKKRAGQKCSQHADCESTLYCNRKKCAAKKDIGASCRSAVECKATCTDGKCAVASVICTELNRQGLLSDRLTDASNKYADEKLDRLVLSGYHYWGRPTARLMKNSKEITKLVEPLAGPWARQMEYKVGLTTKVDPVGEVLVGMGLAHSRELGVWLAKNNIKDEIGEAVIESIIRKHLPGLFDGSDKEQIARIKSRMPLFFGEIKQHAQEQQLK